jgi:rare lipoprotein A
MIILMCGSLCQCAQVGPLPAPMSIPGNLRLSDWEEQGLAAYYGEELHGRPTASGEVFNMRDWTAAHPTLPFGTLVRVLNLNNGRWVDLRVNDRCGHAARAIDVSKAAAVQLEMIGPGVVPSSIRVWERAY